MNKHVLVIEVAVEQSSMVSSGQRWWSAASWLTYQWIKPYFILTLNHLTLPVTRSSEREREINRELHWTPSELTIQLTIYDLQIERRNVALVGDDVDEQVAVLADHVDRFESIGRFI